MVTVLAVADLRLEVIKRVPVEYFLDANHLSQAMGASASAFSRDRFEGSWRAVFAR